MTEHEHVLTWEPGREGKGFIRPDGTVRTWKTNRGSPAHAEMGFDAQPGAVRVMISPDGGAEVHAADPGLRGRLVETLERADPRLRGI